MQSIIPSAIKAGISPLMYDLVYIKLINNVSYMNRRSSNQSEMRYDCRGIITQYSKQEIYNGLATRGAMKGLVLGCSLDVEPCIGDMIIPQCGPYKDICMCIHDGGDAAISCDAVGVVWELELVR